ncbi:hypothetical protein JCM5350_008222 [Sporobolomyces pararoseus]
MLRTTSRRLLAPTPFGTTPRILVSLPRSFTSTSSSSLSLFSSPSPPTTLTQDASNPSQKQTTTTNTISESEISHFSSLSAYWWDPTGEFGLLHRMNPCRIQFMRESLLKVEELPSSKWLRGKKVLDVGCGGGIFAESIARLGAETLAIDASSSNISVAQTHASIDPSLNLINSPLSSTITNTTTTTTTLNDSKGSLEYRHCAAEDLVSQGKQFDVVCAMEVIEHVQDPRGFLECLIKLTKPGGHLLLSTISRTPLAKFLTITMAESVLGLVTPGTHTYSKYLKPQELRQFFQQDKGWTSTRMEQRGCLYNPLKGEWKLLGQGEFGGLGELGNYFAGIRKPLQ